MKKIIALLLVFLAFVSVSHAISIVFPQTITDKYNDLIGYFVRITGDQLTGQLNGTSAVFNGTVNASAFYDDGVLLKDTNETPNVASLLTENATLHSRIDSLNSTKLENGTDISPTNLVSYYDSDCSANEYIYNFYNNGTPKCRADSDTTYTNSSFDLSQISNTGNVNIGSYNFSVDSNVLFVDATNDRVGIGTTSPSSKLQVNGTGIFWGLNINGTDVCTADNALCNQTNELSADQKDAITSADSPNATNYFATLQDLSGGNVTITSIVVVDNAESVTMNKGDPVYFSAYNVGLGVQDAKFSNNSNTNLHADCVIFETIASGAKGQCVISGEVTQTDTSAWSFGDDLYLAEYGNLTNVRPSTAKCVQKIGMVLRSNANNGVIWVSGAGRCNDVPNNINISGTVNASAFYDGGVQIKVKPDNATHSDTCSAYTETDPNAVLKDGSVALTANWNAGAYHIIASYFNGSWNGSANYYTISQIDANFTNYYTKSVIDSNKYNKTEVDSNFTNYYTISEINTNFTTQKTYIDNQDSAQDECSEITGCVENAVTYNCNTTTCISATFNNSINNTMLSIHPNLDTDSTDDLTTSTSWSGDLGGTGSSPTVDDNSHLHSIRNISSLISSGQCTGTNKATNVSINNSGIYLICSADVDTTIKNETTRVERITSTNCTGQVVAGFYTNGTGYCEADDTAASTDTRWTLDEVYLNNVSDVATFNETKLNSTTDARYYKKTEIDTIAEMQIIWSISNIYDADNDNASIQKIKVNNATHADTCSAYTETDPLALKNSTNLNVLTINATTGTFYGLNINETTVCTADNALCNQSFTDTDTNETARFNNLVTSNCSGSVVAYFYNNGTAVCETDDTTAGGGDGVGYNSSTINATQFFDCSNFLCLNTSWVDTIWAKLTDIVNLNISIKSWTSSNYYNKSTIDTNKYNKSEIDANFTLYYPITKIDSNFTLYYKKPEIDLNKYNKSEVDSNFTLYYKKTEIDTNFTTHQSYKHANATHADTCSAYTETDAIWIADRPNYLNTTTGYTRTQIDANFTKYYTVSQVDSNFSLYYTITQVDTNFTTQKTYIDTQDSAQDECSEITGCVENALTNGTNADFNIVNITGNFNINNNFNVTASNGNVGMAGNLTVGILHIDTLNSTHVRMWIP